MVETGDKAPDFTLPDQDGNEVSLKDFSGKWVVLYFYPKDNTSGCTKEAIDFTALKGDFGALGAVILGVSPDSPERHRGFIEKHGLGITLLSDTEKSVMKEYGAWGIKKSYGKETEGVIRSTFLISPDGKVEEVWRKVKVRVKRKSGEVKHAEIVLERLKALQPNS
ncbi:MAG: thioredoxin-dependent thiol peroxidase [Deltaproteobacteria bacterium]|nr:MAG: thioredoxin-dependent thiol peroxidase [Deltaproteobacteria bacterium]